MSTSRRLLVTGSASGIGAATVRLAAERGHEVLGVDLHDADVIGDLSTVQGRRAVVEQVRERVDVLDAVVACAGSAAPVAATLSVNFFGAVEVVTALRPLLARSTAPRAAVIGSITGTLAPDAAVLEACLAGEEDKAVRLADELVSGGAGFTIYATSKHALGRWVRRTCTAPGWADTGIALNAVAPGTVLTPMTKGILDDPVMKRLMDETVPMPLNGYAPPGAVASLLLWLVGEQNTHVTGQVVYVDGGAEAVLRGEELF